MARLKALYLFLRSYLTLRSSPLFDKEYYLNNNPSAAQSRMGPIVHYLKYGAKEGLDPSAQFSTNGYLQRYRDVRDADLNPLVHYLWFGKQENRSTRPFFTPSVGITQDPLPKSTLTEYPDAVLVLSFCATGGTSVYLNNLLSDTLSDSTTVFYARYDLAHSRLCVLVYRGDEVLGEGSYPVVSDFFRDIADVPFRQAIVNSLVCWSSVREALQCVQALKKRQPNMSVVYKVHDYFCVCPSYTLMDSDENYCGIQCDESACGSCIHNSNPEHVYLDADNRNGFSVTQWRTQWNDFFVNTADTVTVFSQSSQRIFTQAYPDAASKVSVVPHRIPPFKDTRIAIIAALLGHKGCHVVQDLLRYMEFMGLNDVRFYLYGDDYGRIQSPLLTKHGAYHRSDLPELLQKDKIDMVFIPSICPETFCYTAGEALSLGYVTACFDLGGQAEQIRASDHGLLLTSRKPHYLYRTFKRTISAMTPTGQSS